MKEQTIAFVIYWTSFWTLLYTWFFYGAVLWLLVQLSRRPLLPPFPDPPPKVTIIIAAYNEEKAIRDRLKNLQEMVYDPNKIEVLVASDGSTDSTPDIVRALESSWGRLRLLDFPEHRGRAAVHNEAVEHAQGDILVFTDAETRFDPHFLEYIIPHFDSDSVGAVSGRIHYVNMEESSITYSAGLYWRLEEYLRCWESALGLLAFGTGAAFSMRRSLYRPMTDTYDDVDYTETIALVSRGYRVHYEPKAIAYDRICSTVGPTHRTRARRTSMAFRSILKRAWKDRLWRRPAILVSVVSHKTLRHLTPFFLIFFAASNAYLWQAGNWYLFTALVQCAFYSLALLGWFSHLKGWKVKPFSLPFNFMVLNYSRFVGVIRGLTQKPPPTYR